MLEKMTRSLMMLTLCAGLSMGLAACGGEDDGDNGGNNTNDTKDDEGFLVPLAESAKTATNREGCETIREVNYGFTAINEIVNYYVNACRLSEYFLFPEFRDSKQSIGDPCFCYGDDCRYGGYERPEIEKIIGCDNVTPNAPGTVKGCFRSTDARKNNINPVIYFPQGICTVMMSDCEPLTAGAEDGICDFAEFGDYTQKDSFTECPAGSALSTFVMPIEVALSTTNPEQANLHIRICLPTCEKDTDCHGYDTYDTIVNEKSQTRCLDVSNACKNTDIPSQPAKVCFDQRMIDQSTTGLCVINNGSGA